MSKRSIEFVILEPVGLGWMVRVKRKFRSAHKPFNEYYGISKSSMIRIEDLINQDKVETGTITLYGSGKAEIEIFPKHEVV